MKATLGRGCKGFVGPFFGLLLLLLGGAMFIATGAHARGDEKNPSDSRPEKMDTPPPIQITFYCGFQAPHSDILNARMKEAFQRIGYSASVTPLPSQRALFLANGEGDGDSSRVPNIKKIAPANTDNLIMVPEISLVAELAIFTKGLEFPVEGWESLEPYRNGARIGAKILEKNVPGDRTFLAQDS